MLEALEKLEYGPGSKRLKATVDLLIEELEAVADEQPQHKTTFEDQGRQFGALDQSTGAGREV